MSTFEVVTCANKLLNPQNGYLNFGIFEGNLFCRGSIWPPSPFPLHISRKTNLISIQLYTIIKQSEKIKNLWYFLKICNIYMETPVPEPLLNCNFIKKETLAQDFSCGFYKIFRNRLFTEHLWMTASTLQQLLASYFAII